MACPKFLRTNLNPTAQPGGAWTYVGYNATQPGPSWAGTPAIPLANVAAGQVYAPGNDNPSINPTAVTAGFYAFDYAITNPLVVPAGACSDTHRIIVEVKNGACPGVSRAITVCSDAAPLSLFDELAVGSTCTPTVGTITGTLTALAGYTGSPSFTFDPSAAASGTYTFTNEVAVTPYSGFTVDCADCNNNSATLSVTVINAEANGTASATGCTGVSQTLNLYALSGSARVGGTWVYLSGPSLTQTLNWNGATINNVSQGATISIGSAASLQTSNLAVGSHVFRYITSSAPCFRYRDVTVTMSTAPSAGVPSNNVTICGGPSCNPLVLNSLFQFEQSGGTFNLTTTSPNVLQVSIDGAPSVPFSNASPLNGISYTSAILVTSFSGGVTIPVQISYTVTNGGCSDTKSGSFNIQPPNTSVAVINPTPQYCINTPAFLLKDNFTGFVPGGTFRIRRKSFLTGSFSDFTGAAFTNQFLGSPPPPDAVHSLTAGFNPAVAPSGWYEVTYTRYADGSLASTCTACGTQSWTYTFRLNGNACGCEPFCDPSTDVFNLDICTGYTDIYGSTYTNFNSGFLMELAGYSYITSCTVQPDFNWWRLFFTQGPANPVINGVAYYNDYPIQMPLVMDWSTTTPGFYYVSYLPNPFSQSGSAYDQLECYGGYEFTITACPPAPCSVNIASLAWNGTTITPTVTGCVGTPTYSWVGPNGFTATTATINPPRIGNYTLTVTCPDGATCTSQSTLVLDCDDLTRTITPTTGDVTVAVTAGPCTTPTYSWTRPNGGGTSTGATITPNNGNGNYVATTLCGGVSTGCTNTFTCNSTVSIANNGSQLTAFAGGCGASPSNYAYLWSGPSNNGATTAAISPTVTGNYTVTVTCVDTGCVISANANFTFTCNLGVTISTSGNNLVATGSGTCTGGTYNYSWNAQPSNVTTTGQTVAYVAGQTYTVTMTCVGAPQSSCPAATAVFSCPAFTVNIA